MAVRPTHVAVQRRTSAAAAPLRHVAAAILSLADVVVLVALVPKWGQLRRDLAAPHAWIAREGADRATATLASAALWLVALWLALGLFGALAAGLPGPAGAIGRALATRVLPAVLVRALAGTVGLTVLLTPIAAGASSLPAPTMPASTTSATVSTSTPISSPPSGGAAPVPSWPTSSPTSPAPTSPASASTPSSRPPAPATNSASASSPTPVASTDSPSPPDTSTQAPATPSAATPSTQPAQPADPGDSVTVRPGDSLWLIAAHRLGPQATAGQIETAWQHWYAANASSIGADPGLIHPGTVLQAPSS